MLVRIPAANTASPFSVTKQTSMADAVSKKEVA